MNTQTSYYQVGPHSFRISIYPNAYCAKIPDAFQPFIVSECSQDTIFELNIKQTNHQISSDNEERKDDIGFEWEGARCFIRPLGDGKHAVFIHLHNVAKTFFMECNDNFSRCTAYLDNQQTDIAPELLTRMQTFAINNFLMMLYVFNAAPYGTLLMHASVVVHEDKGYLFLGKSGTGKSTHSQLWLKHITGTWLLNDDNPVLHLDAETQQAFVYGSPWSGKTPCYKQAVVPAKALVRLEQAPCNEISRDNVVHAFAAILASCSCLKQEKKVYDGILSGITGLASAIPVFHLKCLPDREAAELCRETVTHTDKQTIIK